MCTYLQWVEGNEPVVYDALKLVLVGTGKMEDGFLINKMVTLALLTCDLLVDLNFVKYIYTTINLVIYLPTTNDREAILMAPVVQICRRSVSKTRWSLHGAEDPLEGC